MQNYYKVLGVSKSASKEEIDGAFSRLLYDYSTRSLENEARLKKTKEINKAHEVLSNPCSRAYYDAKIRNTAHPYFNLQQEKELFSRLKQEPKPATLEEQIETKIDHQVTGLNRKLVASRATMAMAGLIGSYAILDSLQEDDLATGYVSLAVLVGIIGWRWTKKNLKQRADYIAKNLEYMKEKELEKNFIETFDKFMKLFGKK